MAGLAAAGALPIGRGHVTSRVLDLEVQKGCKILMRKPRKTVGVIENDASALTAIKDLLGAYGFATIGFSSAEEFLIGAAKKQLDCLLLDIHLDGLSGIELRHRLKTSHPTLPVIFMSGLVDDATRRLALAAGCVALLRKPFPARQLVDAVKKAAVLRK